ncbi:hypothetical protein K2173_013052 [Erythroxylum novogranatense]|uniref:F-box domain-containing protein n=1 Tax=Erythroxylum novogranatense TaxID=1862640 RepID=A0AAV8S676_9ROSI|nr:hypothetical protein K2173_013052 [Erythroxylum novogranatense]
MEQDRELAAKSNSKCPTNHLKQEAEAPMPTLPRELVVDILSRLPVKSLCKFRCVSKSWLSMISSTHFAKIHLGFARRNKAVECSRQRLIMSCQNLYSAEYGSIGSCRDDIREIQAVKLDYAWKSYWIDVVGSCNGLLCIAPNENTLFLFNPSTRESKRIEKALMFELGVDAHLCCHGFGYDSTGDDYKVVRIGSGSVVKRTLEKNWELPYNNSSVYESGLLLNGSVHWAVYSKEGEKPKNLVVAFDLEKEVFRDILAPDTVDPSSRIAIGVFDQDIPTWVRWSSPRLVIIESKTHIKETKRTFWYSSEENVRIQELVMALHAYHQKHPVNLILLGVFTVSLSFLVGASCANTDGKIVLEALILTSAVVLSLTGYTFWAARKGQDFSFLGPILFTGLIILILSSFIQVFFPLGSTSTAVYGGISALIFSGYIVYDTDNLIKRYTYDQYILASVALYLDILNLFLSIMRVLRSADN